MGVLAHDILIEVAKGAVVRRSSQTDEKGIKVVQHLLPQIVDAAVAFVDDNKIEELDRQLCIVDHRHRSRGLPLLFRRIFLLRRFF